MITVLADDLRSTFVGFTREWLGLLSRGEFKRASEMIDSANSYGLRWGSDEIEAALRKYVGGTRVPRVTDPSELPGDGRPDFGEFEDGSGFWLDYDIPLEGEWSDLTVQFEFLREGTGFAVVLHDIHVL